MDSTSYGKEPDTFLQRAGRASLKKEMFQEIRDVRDDENISKIHTFEALQKQ
jgi:hypothetical protein